MCKEKEKILIKTIRKGGRPMARYKGSMERFLEAAERTGDIMLRYIYQKDMMK